jgi:hypothetical protein
MSLNALKSTGTLLAYRPHGTADPYATIAEVGDIDGPGEKTTFHDATTQEDTAEAVVASGIDRFDEIAFPINFIPDAISHDHVTGLRYHRRQKNKLDIRMTHVDGTIDEFVAFVGMFKVKAPVDGILKADLSLRITSAITTT